MIKAENHRHMRINLGEYLDTIQFESRSRTGSNTITKRVIVFCGKYDLSQTEYDELRDKIERNQVVIL